MHPAGKGCTARICTLCAYEPTALLLCRLPAIDKVAHSNHFWSVHCRHCSNLRRLQSAMTSAEEHPSAERESSRLPHREKILGRKGVTELSDRLAMIPPAHSTTAQQR